MIRDGITSTAFIYSNQHNKFTVNCSIPSDQEQDPIIKRVISDGESPEEDIQEEDIQEEIELANVSIEVISLVVKKVCAISSRDKLREINLKDLQEIIMDTRV